MKASDLKKIVGLNLPTELPGVADLITRLERHLTQERDLQSRLAGDDPNYKRNQADYNQRIVTLEQTLAQLRQPNFQFAPEKTSVLSDLSDLSVPQVPSPTPENPRPTLPFQQNKPAQNPPTPSPNTPQPSPRPTWRPHTQPKTGSTTAQNLHHVSRGARSPHEPKRGPRGILNELPEATQQKILDLLESNTEQAVLDILAQPVPQGIGLRITRRSLDRFQYRHRIIDERADIAALAKAAHELVTDPNTTDADLTNAALRIVRAAVLEYATDIQNFESLERLNDVLHKLRRADIADRRQTYLEQKQVKPMDTLKPHADQGGARRPRRAASKPNTSEKPTPPSCPPLSTTLQTSLPVANNPQTCLHRPMQIKPLVFALFFLLSLLSTRAADLTALDAYNKKALRDWQTPGFSIAIIENDKILLTKGYGVREFSKPEPVTENTLFAIASNTKAFTTAALAILVHQNKLNWNDRVQNHLPYFQIFDDPWISHEARIDDLLCHRLGFKTFSGDLIWWNTPYNAEEVIKRARFLKPQYGFRRGYGYSNIAFMAAGEIVAHTSGQSWSQFIRQEILTPLHMTNTALAVSELASRPDVATPHAIEDDGSPRPIPWQSWDATVAAGGVISSAADLAQWLRLQLNEGQLNDHTFWTQRETWKMWSMHNPTAFGPDTLDKDPNFSITGAGLGWMLADYRGNFIVRHGGAYDGMFSHTVMVPKKKIAIVVLSNGMNALPSSIAYYTLDHLLGQNDRDWSAEALKKTAEARDQKKKTKAAEKPLPNTRPSLPLEKYTGTYGGPMYGNATITHEKNKLILRIQPNPDLTADLIHWQHDVFEIKWHKKHAWFGEGKLQFLLNEKSEVTEFKMNVPNEDFWFDELEFKKLK